MEITRKDLNARYVDKQGTVLKFFKYDDGSRLPIDCEVISIGFHDKRDIDVAHIYSYSSKGEYLEGPGKIVEVYKLVEKISEETHPEYYL